MFANCRVLVLSNALKKVSGCIADIICIAQITCKIVNNALLIRSIFSRLDYPRALIDSIISDFLRNVSEQAAEEKPEGGRKIRIILPFKDQVAANAVRRQFNDLRDRSLFIAWGGSEYLGGDHMVF